MAMNKAKYSLFFLLMIPLCNSLFAQDVNELFFDEVSLSFNRTNLADNNTENRSGFGVGVYHSFFAAKMANLVFGIEYNRTAQFKKLMYEGHYAHTTDLTYHLNMASFPVGARVNFGKRIKVFIEAGGYADLMLKSTREGTMHTYFPDENDQIVYKDYPINEKAKLSSVMGVYSGSGVRIPVSSFELVIKGDYKLGLQDLYSYIDTINNIYWRISIGIRHK
jgi:hypothetical protein